MVYAFVCVRTCRMMIFILDTPAHDSMRSHKWIERGRHIIKWAWIANLKQY